VVAGAENTPRFSARPLAPLSQLLSLQMSGSGDSISQKLLKATQAAHPLNECWNIIPRRQPNGKSNRDSCDSFENRRVWLKTQQPW